MALRSNRKAGLANVLKAAASVLIAPMHKGKLWVFINSRMIT
jgi:hypothetical protein